MKVLYIIDSLISGGAETSLAHMAPAYRDLGIELHVAFLKSRWEVADELTGAGAELHPTELDRGRLVQLRALIRLIRRLRPDVVHTTLWEADVLGRTAAALSRTPVVGTFANSNYSEAQKQDPAVSQLKLRGARLIDVLTARAVVRFHAVSAPVADDMAAQMHVRRDRIIVVPRARRRDLLGEPSVERRASVRLGNDIPPDAPVVLAIARQEHQKGLDVLLASTASLVDRMPGVLVLIAGRPGRATADLERQANQLGLGSTVRFLGVRNDVADLIVAADLVAVPSRVEGLPGAVLEAMALERPVVASDLPMVREAIGDHAAALVPVGAAHALADALESALDADNRALMAAARDRFDKLFAPHSVVARLERVYAEAIEESRWSRIDAT